MNHYVFVTSDPDASRTCTPSAFQVAAYRLSKKVWGISERTPHRAALATNDRIIIYIGGQREHSQTFAAAARVASSAFRIHGTDVSRIDAPRDSGKIRSGYAIRLDNIIAFKKPVPIKPILDKLSFVKIPFSNRWGAAVRAGVRKISKEDYDLILSLADRVML
jgi:predicted RNA-binding protein